MLVGLSNTFQCSEQTSVRIALHEASRSAEKAPQEMFRYASSKSIEKGHQGRSLARRWRLPKKEQDAAINAAKKLGITVAEFIRLSIIWLQLGIRRNEINSIENCWIISGDNSARQWSRDNQGQPSNPKVSNLKRAQKEAQQLFDYLDGIRDQEAFKRREERGLISQSMQSERDIYNSDQEWSLKKLLELDENSLEDTIFLMEFNYVRNFSVDWDTAELIVADDLRDYSDPMKMKSSVKLNLIRRGREKQAQRIRAQHEKLKAEQAQDFALASREWKRGSPSSDIVDLEQHRRDRDAAEKVMKQEMEQDRQDYLNEPMLWDDDSHKCLQCLTF